jgi:hypothetical protein
LHSKLEPLSVELKEKMAEVAVVVGGGPRTMEVLGGVVSAGAPRAVAPTASEMKNTVATHPMKNMVREQAAR